VTPFARSVSRVPAWLALTVFWIRPRPRFLQPSLLDSGPLPILFAYAFLAIAYGFRSRARAS
jgi:hypothetical protein